MKSATKRKGQVVELARATQVPGPSGSSLDFFRRSRSLPHPALTKAKDKAGPLEARLDGRRVVLEAEDEIELRCGEASIVLRRNGRVVVRGAYIETRARGTNRVRGGSVAIN